MTVGEMGDRMHPREFLRWHIIYEREEKQHRPEGSEANEFKADARRMAKKMIEVQKGRR